MLSVENVGKSYKKGTFLSNEKQNVLKGISFVCGGGECLGIIGESGSGKSTLGRLLLGIEKPDRGTVTFNNKNVKYRKVRLSNISAVFQDYKSSINPFFTVEDAILEPLSAQNKSRKELEEKVISLLEQVGLPASYRNKYPHELSGGEVQRVCIARAISTEPKCIVLDEAISSLDVSVQTKILELLKDLKRIYNMSYVFITHDLQAAAYLCDRIIIFKDGQIEEEVEIENLKNVKSAYAKKLLGSMITF